MSEYQQKHKYRTSVRLEFIPLVDRSIPANGAHIDHSIAELNESTPLLWDVQVRDVLEDEIDQLLVLLFSDPLYEAVAGKRFA